MQIANKDISKTKAKYSVVASAEDLNNYRQIVTSNLKDSVKVPGFRPGKAPTDMILKHADQNSLQNEFLNFAINDLYLSSQKDIVERIVGNPEIAVTKFVPFSQLEISVEVAIVRDIKLPDYKKMKLEKAKASVSADLIERNLADLQKRAATFTVVKRPAKKDDLVVVDFDATDPKTKEKLVPASAENYRLVIGDHSLIAGFEENLIGLAANKTKAFDLTFPKDYGDKGFVGRKVHFEATVKEVDSIALPKIDDEFAKAAGPFKTLAELKTELKKQLQAGADRQANIDFENQILNKLAEGTVTELDEALVSSEVDFLLANAKKSALNRGQTWQEFLVSLGQSEDDYKSEARGVAITRIKGGLAIGEIAVKEGLSVTDQEVDNEIANLKTRYQDQAMRDQLDDPDNRRELRMRLLTEKVLDFIQKQIA